MNGDRSDTPSGTADPGLGDREIAAGIAALRQEVAALRRQNEEGFRLLAARQQAAAGTAASGTGQRPSRPVFVLGCVRSGTTVVARALQVAGIPGWTEGHSFPILYRLKTVIDESFAEEKVFLGTHSWAIDWLSPGVLEERLVDHFEAVQIDGLQSTRWFDKTPGAEMIAAAPYLASLWPSARFIYCQRRGVENVASQMRRFGSDPVQRIPFAEACQNWARCVELWASVSPSLPVLPSPMAMVVEHERLVSEPDQMALAIASHLGLDPLQAERMAAVFTGEFPERTASDYAAESLEGCGWSAEQQDFFVANCGPAMHQAGYSMGGAADERAGRTITLTYTEDPTRVTLSNGSFGTTFRQTEPGVFLIHPATEGPPISVTFRNIGFAGHNRFVVRADIKHPQSHPIVYAMRLVNPADGNTVFEARHTVCVGKPDDWVVDFPPLMGPHDVCLSTEMAEDAPNAFYAWATWTTPRFLTA